MLLLIQTISFFFLANDSITDEILTGIEKAKGIAESEETVVKAIRHLVKYVCIENMRIVLHKLGHKAGKACLTNRVVIILVVHVKVV